MISVAIALLIALVSTSAWAPEAHGSSGDGHRTQTKEYTAGTLTKTWDFRYQGDAIVEEKLTDAAHPSGSVVRSYVVDKAGSIVKLTVPAGETGGGSYLVTWNGHDDALAPPVSG